MESTEASTTASASTDQSTASTEQKTAETISPQPQSTLTENIAKSTGEISEYQPNFKFKVKDKELEFDDTYKQFIKNAELEKKFRDLHERAFGLDEVKTSRDYFKKQFDDVNQKYADVENSLKVIGNYVKKGDFRTFFETLGIPKDKIINYAIEELKYAELPADQKAALEQQRAMQLDYQQQLSQNQQLQTQMAQLVQQQTEFSLNHELAKPEIAQVVQSYDTRVGKPGAFMSEVIRRGQYYEAVHKISPPASQLVGEVVQLIGGMSQGAQLQTNSQVMQGQHNSASQTQKDKPIIPTVGGNSGKSPTRKVYTSIDDLKKARQQMSQT